MLQTFLHPCLFFFLLKESKGPRGEVAYRLSSWTPDEDRLGASLLGLLALSIETATTGAQRAQRGVCLTDVWTVWYNSWFPGEGKAAGSTLLGNNSISSWKPSRILRKTPRSSHAPGSKALWDAVQGRSTWIAKRKRDGCRLCGCPPAPALASYHTTMGFVQNGTHI